MIKTFALLVVALFITTPAVAKKNRYAPQRKVAEVQAIEDSDEEISDSEEEVDSPPPRVAENQKYKKRKEKYAGLMLGFAKSTAETSSLAFAFGGRVGFDVYGDSTGSIALGFSATSAGNTERETTGNTTEKLHSRISVIAPELLARHVFGTGLYFGGRVGIAIMNLSYSKFTDTTTTAEYSGGAVTFASSSVIGYEQAFSRNFRGNIDLSYITVSKSKIYAGSLAVTTDNLSAFQLLAGAQFNWY